MSTDVELKKDEMKRKPDFERKKISKNNFQKATSEQNHVKNELQ